MSIPQLDEQFLPRLLAIFYATFHPTEGPKVIYQVPEGSITEEKTSSKPEGTSSAAASGHPQPTPTATAEPLFDFSALSEYLIPKAPLCGRLVTSIARGKATVNQRHHERPSRAPSVVPGRSASARSGGSSRASSARPRGAQDGNPSEKQQLEQRTYKIMGFPTLIEDASKYQRNNFIFNLCFVFEGETDIRPYEPVVRKCGRVLRGLEETQSFLSSPKSLPRMYGVIEQLFEDLSSYHESFVALPEAPHTSYLKTSSKPNSPEANNLISAAIGPDDFISLGASFASLRGEHHRNIINEKLRLKQMQQAHLSSSRPASSMSSARASPTHQQAPSDHGDVGGARSRSGSASSPSELGRILTPLTTIRNQANPMLRSNSASGTSGPGSEGPNSPISALSPSGPEGRRPSLARSSTILGLSDDAAPGAFPSEESRDNAMGIVSSRRQSDLSRDLSAAESLGNVLTNHDSGAYDSINTAAGTRRSSRGSPVLSGQGAENESTLLEHLTESIVSLRTIDAALSNSVNALRTETADATKRTALVEKREPPHGLGRTVRDAINLKLFPVFPNPTPINDWDVPVALLDLLSRVDGNWDLTMRRILPFIDGVNHVKRIAQLADADLGLTRACLEHLMFYGCIIVVEIFQYFNMYTVRPAIAKIADDQALGRECANYVTRPGFSSRSYPELLRLYSLLRAGTTLHDWIEDNDIDSKGIDVRRFVSFGVIQGFLRRVHRYPIYLGSRAGEDGASAFDTSVVSTVRNSPVINSPAIKSNDSNFRRAETNDQHRREQSGSREPRDRRPRELSGMSGAYSAFQRIGRDGSVDSPGVGTRTPPTRRGASEARLSNVVLAGAGAANASAFNLGDSSNTASGGGGSQFSTSPTKRQARMRQRPGYRQATTTAVDVAAVAFQAERPAQAATTSGPQARSPRKRASAIGLSTAIPGTTTAGITSSAGVSGIATAGGAHIHPRSGVTVIPPELFDMLDGTHSDDEICVQFSISWPDLEKMLIQIGLSPNNRMDPNDTDEEDIASTQRSDWRRWPGGSMFGTMAAGGGASSGWSKPRMSGFSGGGGVPGAAAGRSQASAVASSGHQSSRGQGAESSGFGVPWGNDPDESGWGPMTLDREAVESGDLGLDLHLSQPYICEHVHNRHDDIYLNKHASKQQAFIESGVKTTASIRSIFPLVAAVRRLHVAPTSRALDLTASIIRLQVLSFSTGRTHFKMSPAASTPTRTSPRKAAAAASSSPSKRQSSTASPAIKAEVEDIDFPPTPNSMGGSPARSKRKRGVKTEPSAIDELLSSSSVKEEEDADDKSGLVSEPASPSKKQTTSERKLASYKTSILASPFPDHPLPTAEEAERVAWILGDFHGYKRESEGGRGLPKYTTPKGEDRWGGCGDVPSVLDAVIRTVLSCNTSNRNSAAAHRSLTEHFGNQNWQAIHDAPESELVESIRCGGLANNKARTIKGILRQTHERHGTLSLDHLHDATDDDIMQELVSFNGVGPKVASCVLAFCIGRESMAVDTHVFRLCKALGWVPEKANRDQTYYHLHERVPGPLKYALHVLLIKHGKMCRNCSAKGFATVKEESDGEGEGYVERECPLKKNGLLGRKGKALRDAAAGAGGVKTERAETTEVKSDSSSRKKVKTESSSSEIDYAAALERARKATEQDLLRLLQKARSTRSSNPISSTLKSKDYSLEILAPSSLSSEQRKRVFSLFESNMKSMYRNSTLGWKPSAKKKELFDDQSRFVIIRPPANEGAEIAGFGMFRFDTEPCSPTDPVARDGEEELEVAYLYEIQVRQQNQRDGLGREIVDAVYQLAQAVRMRKVMLTVFDENKAARKFYERMGFEQDANSPGKEGGKVDFETMCKVVQV